MNRWADDIDISAAAALTTSITTLPKLCNIHLEMQK